MDQRPQTIFLSDSSSSTPSSLDDDDGARYLMQTFTLPVVDRPTLFLEIISREVRFWGSWLMSVVGSTRERTVESGNGIVALGRFLLLFLAAVKFPLLSRASSTPLFPIPSVTPGAQQQGGYSGFGARNIAALYRAVEVERKHAREQHSSLVQYSSKQGE